MQEYAKANNRFAAQFSRNLIANILFFIVNMVIGIMLVPYFISTLGIAAYGLIPLATSITGYVGIVVGSLNTSVSRYLTVDLQQENYDAANRTFNTAILGISVIIAIMIPVVCVIAYYIPMIFNVPAGQENDTAILFLCVFIAFLIRAWSGNYTVQLFAYNRLDYQNVINIVNVVVQTGLIIILFKFYQPSLVIVGLAIMVGSVLSSALAVILARRVCPHLKISFGSVDISRLKDLSGMSWWAIVNQIGSLLFLQIDLIVVNILFGASSAGEYAIALQWAVLLRTIATTISGVLTPIIFTHYAKGNMKALTGMMVSSVKLTGLFMALPIGLLCGLAPQILTIWVGKDLTFLAPLIVLMALHLTVNLSVLPLFSINVAYNKIRIPGILTFVMGGANIILAIAIPVMLGWGFYGVAIAGAVVLTLKNAIFTPWYATKVMGIKNTTFTRSMLPGIVIAIVLMAAGVITNMLVQIDTLLSLVIVSCVLSLIYLIIVWQYCLTADEHKFLLSCLPESIRRWCNRLFPRLNAV